MCTWHNVRSKHDGEGLDNRISRATITPHGGHISSSHDHRGRSSRSEKRIFKNVFQLFFLCALFFFYEFTELCHRSLFRSRRAFMQRVRTAKSKDVTTVTVTRAAAGWITSTTLLRLHRPTLEQKAINVVLPWYMFYFCFVFFSKRFLTRIRHKAQNTNLSERFNVCHFRSRTCVVWNEHIPVYPHSAYCIWNNFRNRKLTRY